MVRSQVSQTILSLSSSPRHVLHCHEYSYHSYPSSYVRTLSFTTSSQGKSSSQGQPTSSPSSSMFQVIQFESLSIPS